MLRPEPVVEHMHRCGGRIGDAPDEIPIVRGSAIHIAAAVKIQHMAVGSRSLCRHADRRHSAHRKPHGLRAFGRRWRHVFEFFKTRPDRGDVRRSLVAHFEGRAQRQTQDFGAKAHEFLSAIASKRFRACWIAVRFCRAHSPMPLTGPSSDRPSAVNSYSTLGGMVGNTVRVTMPSRSRPRSVKVSMRCEMLPSALRISLKRRAPSPSSPTTRMVHLSPTRARTSLTARQSSGTCRLLGNIAVPSCLRRAVIYLSQVSNRNHEIEGSMAKLKIAIVIGTTRA